MAQSPFKPITDQKKKLELLDRALKEKSVCEVWSDDRAVKIHGRLRIIDFKLMLVTFEASEEHLALAAERKITKNPPSDFYFKILFSTSLLFFQGKFKRLDGPHLVFTFTNSFHSVQRRKYPRIPMPPIYQIELCFTDPARPETVLKYQASDLSAGGLSLEIRPTNHELDFITQSSVPIAVTFSLYGKLISATLALKATIHSKEKHQSTRLGFEFASIDEKDRDLVSHFVETEGFKYYRDLLKEQGHGI